MSLDECCIRALVRLVVTACVQNVPSCVLLHSLFIPFLSPLFLYIPFTFLIYFSFYSPANPFSPHPPYSSS